MHFPSSNASRSVPFQVKRVSATDWRSTYVFYWCFHHDHRTCGVSHLVLSFSDTYSLWRFHDSVIESRSPHLQRLEIYAPDDVVNEILPGERARFFTHLASHCPRLVWLDVHLRVLCLGGGGDAAPPKVDWPEERQRLRIVFHHHQPEEDDHVGWLEPWRVFRGNVRVVDDAEEIRESKKKAEAQWIVSPCQSP